MRKLRLFIMMFAICLAGCSGDPGKRPEAVEVTGKVTRNGAPLRDVNLNLQPQDQGHPMVVKTGADGSVKAEMIPGRYVYFLTPADGKQSAFRGIAEKYQSPHKDNVVDVRAGTEFRVNVE